MEKNWVIKEKGDLATIKHLSGVLGISEALANLMVQRSITSVTEAKAFFEPDLGYLHDPFLMKDMNVAVERISTAIKKNEKILVYGDYDVDGTTAVAMVYSFLMEQFSNVDYYIPDRYKEGYGVSFQGIDYASQTNCKVMITLDCGIKAVDKVKYARSKGLDVIILATKYQKQWRYSTPSSHPAVTRTRNCRDAGWGSSLYMHFQGFTVSLSRRYFHISIS
jgi:single-stranded-DNA-specific exonuclease